MSDLLGNFLICNFRRWFLLAPNKGKADIPAVVMIFIYQVVDKTFSFTAP